VCSILATSRTINIIEVIASKTGCLSYARKANLVIDTYDILILIKSFNFKPIHVIEHRIFELSNNEVCFGRRCLSIIEAIADCKGLTSA
jgi:hypothetical protein